ncbi:MAG: VCBS repeat-containing protein [Chitinophagaceae bacterium]|nr:VCBS repeat-containing protein [Chitinophagaceae bacterium]
MLACITQPSKFKIHLLLFLLVSGICVDSFSQTTNPGFKKHVISNDFISEGVAVGDVNNDGKTDVLAGPSWFEAPNWKRHDIDTFRIFPPKTTYARSFLNHCMDINQDGWVDLIVMDFPGLSADWFENPGKKPGYWKKHRLYDYVGNESPAFTDVDGDGRDDIVCADSKTNQMIWLRSPTVKGDTTWTRFTIGERNVPGTDIQGHGLGYGDINGDGRKDVFTKDGWWEGPADVTQPGWTFHPADIGEDCSQMHVVDVNADGLPDVVSASAHRYGIWWHPQFLDSGYRYFDHYTISFSTSQTHATAMADINGDGNPDLVTGKRYFAHLERLNPSNKTTIDPGTYEKPVLYWFELTPGKRPYWIEHEIDNDSGVGINIIARDINDDGQPDIVIANKRGIFFFENKMNSKK